MRKIERIKELTIDREESVLAAIQQMDNIKRKLLIVTEKGKYRSLLSIGDIQRALIKQIDIQSPINSILRNKAKITIANDRMTLREIRNLIFKERVEFMPVIDSSGNLIEVHFWQEHFDSKIPQKKGLRNIPVVVIAGGRGSRLKPITNIIPKALLPIDDKPIIELIRDRFKSYGVQKFFFMLNYKHEMIQSHFNKKAKNQTIEFIIEKKPLGTAGCLSLISERINQTFFVSNCDILINTNYNEIFKYHRDNNCEITLVSALKHYSLPYGTLEVTKKGFLSNIEEKPELTFLINSGMYVLEPHLLKDVPKDRFFDITNLIEVLMKRKSKIGVFPISEKSWLDIGEWDEYNRTQKYYQDYFID